MIKEILQTLIRVRIIIPIILLFIKHVNCEETCQSDPGLHGGDCIPADNGNPAIVRYSKGANHNWEHFKTEVESALKNYQPCLAEKCSCHYPLIKKDLLPFANGIEKADVEEARPRGTLYQVLNHRLFRDQDCMFPSRCSGIEHFILKIIKKLPDMEFIINTRDWPQVPKHYGAKRPILSFSKTEDYLDITYPAWTFWEGGPAISIYPTGLGRWDKLRKSLIQEADSWPWETKKDVAFFRGSRTSSERDPLIYLSRKSPELADAQYTKNQAWKSDADTLYAPPATEVSLESHCPFKYLFNYRGVAASFRLKHLFLCKSLVFHAGQDWTEFFYPQLKPWVHYIPVPSTATEEDLRELILFARENDDLARDIASRGFHFVKEHLRMKDVFCYWRKLLLSYAKLMTYEVEAREGLVEIRDQQRTA